MRTLKIIGVAMLLFISFKSYPAVHVISQSGTSFSPNDLVVNVGDVIRWEWSAGTHTTTSKAIPNGASTWDSPLTSASASFEYTVTVAGVYNYVCTPHESVGMKGSFTAQTATDVDENTSLTNFSLYPNPASSFININSNVNGEVILSNILGKTIKNFTLNELPRSDDSYRVDLSDVTNGIYFITIIPSDARNRISGRFIKK